MLFRLHKGDRNGLLLGTLLLTLAFGPYVQEGSITRYIFNALLTAVMVIGALSAAQTHGRTKLVGVGLALGLLGVFLYSFYSQGHKHPTFNLLEILFLTTVGLSILGKVLSPGEVTLDKIFGAISVYLMAGLVVGLCAEFLEILEPGSFTGSLNPEGVSGADMIYFGYVTFTTLGYGDIAPVTAKARSLAMIGAIAGPLYIAILIARLVGDFGSKVEEHPVPTDRL